MNSEETVTNLHSLIAQEVSSAINKYVIENSRTTSVLDNMFCKKDPTAQESCSDDDDLPMCLRGTVVQTFNITGITPVEMAARLGSSPFDYEELKAQFMHICTDFGLEVSLQEKSRAFEFALNMIYKVQPEWREVTKRSEDKTWRFNFMYESEDKLVVRVAFVKTFKSKDRIYKQTDTKDNIILTVKEAMLLAVDTLTKINVVARGLTPPVMLMTTLAEAVFPKEAVGKICTELNETPDKILAIMNTSCQSGGQYLRESDMSVALVAAVAVARIMEDKKLKERIVNKTSEQYIHKKKQYNLETFRLFGSLSNGGVPKYFEVDAKMAAFEGDHSGKSTMSAKTATTSQIDVRGAEHLEALLKRIEPENLNKVKIHHISDSAVESTNDGEESGMQALDKALSQDAVLKDEN